MSLDITLINPTPITRWSGTGVFVREGGHNKELTVEEVQERWPGSAPTNELVETYDVFHVNVTHNLNKMAEAAYLYQVMWYPDSIGIEYAYEALAHLGAGYRELIANPDIMRDHNPTNGWGTYEQLVDTVREYIIACVTYPETRIEVDR